MYARGRRRIQDQATRADFINKAAVAWMLGFLTVGVSGYKRTEAVLPRFWKSDALEKPKKRVVELFKALPLSVARGLHFGFRFRTREIDPYRASDWHGEVKELALTRPHYTRLRWHKWLA